MLWLQKMWLWVSRLLQHLHLTSPISRPKRYGRRKPARRNKPVPANAPKPAWVIEELLHLKTQLPETSGCRALADIFNRRFARQHVTVQKTFVNEALKKHRYELQILRQKIKHTPPKSVPFNHVWAMDLTGKTDELRRQHLLLGIIEHHTRACLTLKALKDKTTLTLLLHLLDAIAQFGRPRILRTDNEPVFTSRLFTLTLKLLGIRHRRSQLGCPWQNGRIERFFGTLKQKLNQWSVSNREQLNLALSQFRFWYNHVRLHQNLNARTPAEVWRGIDWRKQSVRNRDRWFDAWDGLLTGYI